MRMREISGAGSGGTTRKGKDRERQKAGARAFGVLGSLAIRRKTDGVRGGGNDSTDTQREGGFQILLHVLVRNLLSVSQMLQERFNHFFHSSRVPGSQCFLFV